MKGHQSGWKVNAKCDPWLGPGPKERRKSFKDITGQVETSEY